MKRILLTFLVMGFSFFGLFAQDKSFKTIDANAFEKAMKDTTVVVVDVRSQEEYNEGHIDGVSCLIDVQKEDFETKALATLPKDKTIAVYCRSGRRSKTAAGVLASNGYTVLDLDGGFLAWEKAEKPVAKE